MNRQNIQKLTSDLEKSVLNMENGSVIGCYILTMIDHWNNNIEKVVVLQERAIAIIKYDFVANVAKDVKVIPLNTLTTFQTGSVVYPAKSLMKPRNCGGLKLIWGDLEQVSMTQKWNPICRTIPSGVLIHHPLYYEIVSKMAAGTPENGGADVDKSIYDVDSFSSNLRQLLEGTGTIVKTNEDIIIESYGNVSSVVFNQSNLGFSKFRNGVSF